MVTLEQLAYDTLGQVYGYISPPRGYSGNVFTEGELAWVTATITNNSDVTLRNVVAKVTASGAVRVEPG